MSKRAAAYLAWFSAATAFAGEPAKPVRIDLDELNAKRSAPAKSAGS